MYRLRSQGRCRFRRRSKHLDQDPCGTRACTVPGAENVRASIRCFRTDSYIALAGCPIPELQHFLSSVPLPAFFNAFRNGKVVFLRPNDKFGTRHAGMRAGYTAIQYGRLDRLGTGQNPFETMERWRPLMPAVQLRLLLEVATLALFPRQQYFTGTRSGLLSVFIPGERFVEQRQTVRGDSSTQICFIEREQVARRRNAVLATVLRHDAVWNGGCCS